MSKPLLVHLWPESRKCFSCRVNYKSIYCSGDCDTLCSVRLMQWCVHHSHQQSTAVAHGHCKLPSSSRTLAGFSVTGCWSADALKGREIRDCSLHTSQCSSAAALERRLLPSCSLSHLRSRTQGMCCHLPVQTPHRHSRILIVR